jgi:hypothetical protein
MTTTKPLAPSAIKTINGLAVKGGADALLDFRSTMTKAIANYRKTPEGHRGYSMAQEGIRTGLQRIDYIDLKLAELTAK